MDRSCPGEQDLAAFVEGALASSDQANVIQHLDACAACFELVASLGRMASESAPAASESLRTAVAAASRRAPTWRYLLPAVSAAAAVLIAVSWWGRPESGGVPAAVTPHVVALPPQTVSQERAMSGGALVHVEQPPDGAAIRGPFEIAWNGPTEAASYEVQVATAAGDVLWTRQLEGTRREVRVDATLPPGSTCYVWVAAYLPEGRRLTSNVVKIEAAARP